MNLSSIILILWLSVFSSNAAYTAEGRASFYSDRMQGQVTASGEPYNKEEFTAAHATLPFDTKVQVTNKKNGKSVIVRINDRMAHNRHRIIDVSKAAAKELDIILAGYGTVRLAEVKNNGAKQQEAPLAVSEPEQKR
ncbi:septal ring lytic transglycosylase RlpA family protein [Pontibacter harenae]|uniref:septal ring lytic transglycosylase RlpA family protein n=1 Tax=Pontibacter harenae TaxID=2894083 RepID=UPI001E62FBE3|nr:septal ring lytic transglycosylase RlpA family protein [Pontibacter harenae]MCC9168109.1 septal ring lytic transglycosylase RlpA family protein [Pontibacter harenae]